MKLAKWSVRVKGGVGVDKRGGDGEVKFVPVVGLPISELALKVMSKKVV